MKTNQEKIIAEINAIARRLAGSDCRVPVRVVDGDAEPAEIGEAGHYTTPAGSPVYHPRAYARKGRVVYHLSTVRVEIGAKWYAREIGYQARVFA